MIIVNSSKLNRDPLKKMKKNKIDAFNNMPTIFKYDTNQQVLYILKLY